MKYVESSLTVTNELKFDISRLRFEGILEEDDEEEEELLEDIDIDEDVNEVTIDARGSLLAVIPSELGYIL